MTVTEARVLEILAEIFEPDARADVVGPDAELARLGLSSLNLMKVIVRLESEFDVEFEDADLDFSGFRTVRELCLYIEQRRPEARP